MTKLLTELAVFLVGETIGARRVAECEVSGSLNEIALTFTDNTIVILRVIDDDAPQNTL